MATIADMRRRLGELFHETVIVAAILVRDAAIVVLAMTLFYMIDLYAFYLGFSKENPWIETLTIIERLVAIGFFIGLVIRDLPSFLGRRRQP